MPFSEIACFKRIWEHLKQYKKIAPCTYKIYHYLYSFYPEKFPFPKMKETSKRMLLQQHLSASYFCSCTTDSALEALSFCLYKSSFHFPIFEILFHIVGISFSYNFSPFPSLYLYCHWQTTNQYSILKYKANAIFSLEKSVPNTNGCILTVV